MSLAPGEEIGEEVHEDRDQFFCFAEGEGLVIIDGKENKVSDDYAVIVPAGCKHNVKNVSDDPLQFYTLYGPPEHKDKTVHKTREQAEADEERDHFDGKTTE